MIAGADRIALSGWLAHIGTHSHAAPAVVVGIDAPLLFVGDGSHRSRASLLAPGFRHAVKTGSGRIAVFVLPAHAVQRDGTGIPVRELSHPARWVELAQALSRRELDDFSAVDRCLARERIRARPVDDRLRVVLEMMAQHLDRNTPVDEIAGAVGLSSSRLMSLSREHLGTSLRGYRRWLRAFRVARDYARGVSLTQAALDSGFSSSAHLSFAAREHFGIKPSDILTAQNRSAIRAV